MLHPHRREFVKGLSALAGSAAFLGYDLRIANAEPPPETTKIRLIQVPAICPAPQYIAEELLRPKPCSLRAQMMRTGARFHAYHTRGQVGEEGGHLITSELPLEHRFASRIDPVHLKHVFRQVDANCRNVHVGRPSRFEWFDDTSTLAQRCRFGWGRPYHCYS